MTMSFGANGGGRKAVKRILFATIGSLGDLHPCLALATELERRGHKVTIASTEFYRNKVQELGLAFHPIRPDWDPSDRELIRQCEDLKSGPEVLFRRMVLPVLPETYRDLLPAAAEADLMIAGELLFAAPLVSEKLGLPWVSAILSPVSFFSAYDPSVLVNVPQLIHLRKLDRRVYRAGLDMGRLAARHWWEPVRKLRRQQGLRVTADPMFRDKFSPHRVLALFSRWLAEPQPDWPKQTVQTGFIYFDRDERLGTVSPQLAHFLTSGEPPVIFTLGSTAVHAPGSFFEHSLAAARLLGRRAVLLGSELPLNEPHAISARYAPYSQVFAHAAAVVHQGGSGTTAQAMRAGKPMLVVPFGWDQPDNAARIERRGLGLELPRKRYSTSTAAAALRTLLEDPQFAARARVIGEHLSREDGLTRACDALEAVTPVDLTTRPAPA